MPNDDALIAVATSGSDPPPDGASNLYLVDVPGSRVAFDFGTGAYAKLKQHSRLEQIDAVVISHMHADHYFGLADVRYALKFFDDRRQDRLRVWLPPGGETILRQSFAHLSAGEPPELTQDFFNDVMQLREYDPNKVLHVGEARIRFTETTHFISTFAALYDCGDISVAYSADTGPDDRVARLAENARLFVCEASDGVVTPEGFRGHINAAEAGVLARRAGVESLLLTSYKDNVTPAALTAAAHGEFGGRVAVLDDHQSVSLERNKRAETRSPFGPAWQSWRRRREVRPKDCWTEGIAAIHGKTQYQACSAASFLGLVKRSKS